MSAPTKSPARRSTAAATPSANTASDLPPIPSPSTFALEAKLYDLSGSGVGVAEVARLISRLRHRQFGVLVTTSYVAKQAYQEIRADQHPVVILAGRDIVDLLRGKAIHPARRHPLAHRGLPHRVAAQCQGTQPARPDVL